MSIEYGLVFTFFSAQLDIPYSIPFVQVTLSHFNSLFDGHPSTIARFAACALFRALSILIELM